MNMNKRFFVSILSISVILGAFTYDNANAAARTAVRSAPTSARKSVNATAATVQEEKQPVKEETIQEIKEAISLVKNNKDIEGFYFGAYEITSVYADIVFTTPNKRYFDKRRVYVLDNDVFITHMGGNVLDHCWR